MAAMASTSVPANWVPAEVPGCRAAVNDSLILRMVSADTGNSSEEWVQVVIGSSPILFLIPGRIFDGPCFSPPQSPYLGPLSSSRGAPAAFGERGPSQRP